MVLPSFVALGKIPALSEHCIFVPYSLAPTWEQLTAEGEKCIQRLGDTGLPPELCYLLVQAHRFTETLGCYALCRSSVHSPLCPQQSSGVESHHPLFDGGGCLGPRPTAAESGMPGWHNSVPPTLFPVDLGSTEIAIEVYMLFLSHLILK